MLNNYLQKNNISVVFVFCYRTMSVAAAARVQVSSCCDCLLCECVAVIKDCHTASWDAMIWLVDITWRGVWCLTMSNMVGTDMIGRYHVMRRLMLDHVQHGRHRYDWSISRDEASDAWPCPTWSAQIWLVDITWCGIWCLTMSNMVMVKPNMVGCRNCWLVESLMISNLLSTDYL